MISGWPAIQSRTAIHLSLLKSKSVASHSSIQVMLTIASEGCEDWFISEGRSGGGTFMIRFNDDPSNVVVFRPKMDFLVTCGLRIRKERSTRTKW